MQWQKNHVLLYFCSFLFAVNSTPIHEALIGKSSLTEESLDEFLEGMDTLGKLQRKIFANDARNHLGAPDVVIDEEMPSFAESSLAVNTSRPWALPYLFEGDIILTPDQMNNAISYAKQQLAEMDGIEIEERSKRTLISNPNLRWNSFPIPFTISRGGLSNIVSRSH
uniref:Uncharacterized protein n=1 Tax=Panagrolaimus superbus TaxID=310955 RepID=A0A914YN64_9BILA